MASNPGTVRLWAFLVSESGSQRPSVVGAWSVNPRHAVVSVGAGWRYMASSGTVSAAQLGGLAGSPKAGVAGSNPAGGTV
jgi:hypothetical protein